MLTSAGFSCWIEVLNDNEFQPAIEYGVKDPTALHQSCFIESQAGATWRLGWRLNIEEDAPCLSTDLSIVCFVDGQQQALRNIRKGCSRTLEYFEGARDPNDRSVTLPFVFSQIVFKEEVGQLNPPNKEIGTICCMVYRVDLGEQKSIKGKALQSALVSRPETDLKQRITHVTSHGSPQRQAWSETYTKVLKFHDREGDENVAHIVMEFKYRSESMLELQGMKPVRTKRVPSPDPAGSDEQQSMNRPPDEADPATGQSGTHSSLPDNDEKPSREALEQASKDGSLPGNIIEQLLRQLQGYEREMMGLKREVRQLKRSRNSNSNAREFVDLTQDDD